tara:strand:+ start:6749 stop:6955 length:207 start_codon:yes stop_codon:yes gene_type:complete
MKIQWLAAQEEGLKQQAEGELEASSSQGEEVKSLCPWRTEEVKSLYPWRTEEVKLSVRSLEKVEAFWG